MRVIVSAEGPDLDAPLGVNFARCSFYLVVDVDTMACEAVKNPGATAEGGAGSRAARIVMDQGAEAVITGMIGPNAFAELERAGIPAFSAPAGTARSAVQAYRAAHLLPLAGPNAVARAPFARPDLSHASAGNRGSSARRRRRGPESRRAGSVGDELANLKARARELQEELAAMQTRIAQIEQRGQQKHKSTDERNLE